MNIAQVADILLAAAVIVWIVIRQLSWRPVSPSRMWRLPVIIGIIGVIELARMKDVHRLTTLDVSVLLVELLISAGLGAAMGAIAVFRTRDVHPGGSDDPRRRDSRRHDSRRAGLLGNDRGSADPVRLNPDGTETLLETRTGGMGLVLWLVLVGVRVGVDVAAADLGSALASATGVILVMVAANRVARIGVILYRSQKPAALAA